MLILRESGLVYGDYEEDVDGIYINGEGDGNVYSLFYF